MKIERKWAMPSRHTFTIKPIKELLNGYIKGGWWVDPFAGFNSPAHWKNDLNEDAPTDKHLEALEFLKREDIDTANGVLFDPPYSPRQLSECYKKHGLAVNMETTQSSYWRKCKDEIDRILKPEGIVISFGWNSNGMGKTRGYEMVEILLVAHGGNHNDTICVVEKKETLLKQLK